MAEESDDQEMEETRRIMGRLVKTPPQPKGGKKEKGSTSGKDRDDQDDPDDQ